MGEATEQATVFFQQQNEKLYPGKQQIAVGHLIFENLVKITQYSPDLVTLNIVKKLYFRLPLLDWLCCPLPALTSSAVVAATVVAAEAAGAKVAKRPPRLLPRSKEELTSLVVWMTPRPVCAVLKRRRPSRPSKRTPSWNVPTRTLRNVITLMSHSSLPPKRKSAKRTLRRPVKSPSSNKLSTRLSRSATSPSKRSATDKDPRNVEPSMNLLVLPDTLRSNPVSPC